MTEGRGKIHFDLALKSKEIRDTVAAVEFIRNGLRMLDQLSPTGIEAVRDRAVFMWKDRKGPLGDLGRALIVYLEERLREERVMERRTLHGITGVDEDEMA